MTTVMSKVTFHARSATASGAYTGWKMHRAPRVRLFESVVNTDRRQRAANQDPLRHLTAERPDVALFSAYDPAARMLFAILGLVYGTQRTLSKFKVLELVTRVPSKAGSKSPTSPSPKTSSPAQSGHSVGSGNVAVSSDPTSVTVAGGP